MYILLIRHFTKFYMFVNVVPPVHILCSPLCDNKNFIENLFLFRMLGKFDKVVVEK